MDLDRFVRERRPSWTRLEQRLDVFERSTEAAAGHERILELVALYRQACSDLNQARSYTANPLLLDSLNQLVGRAYRFIYSRAGRPNLRETFWHFISVDIPLTFRRESMYVLAAFLPFLCGAIFGFAAVATNRSYAEAFVPADFYHPHPSEHVREIEEADTERIDDLQKALTFGSFLYTHNIQVTFIAFSLGALTLVGGLFILFYNGVILGAIACMYHQDGVATFFYAWVGPHGALEIPATIFAGAAGLRAARAILMPGEQTRQAALREAFIPCWRMMCAAAMMLVIAGLIEGSFSQFSARTVSYEIKIAVAVCLFTSLVAYLFLVNRRQLVEE